MSVEYTTMRMSEWAAISGQAYRDHMARIGVELTRLYCENKVLVDMLEKIVESDFFCGWEEEFDLLEKEAREVLAGAKAGPKGE